MRNISPIKESQIDWVVDYLMEQYKQKKNPPDGLLEWQKRFFPRHLYPEVYQILHVASQKLAKVTEGRIQFRHNLMQDIWRFHEGLDDYLMLLWGTGQRIDGHIHTQQIDWEYDTVLVPKIKDEIEIITPEVIGVGKKRELTLKQKYSPS